MGRAPQKRRGSPGARGGGGSRVVRGARPGRGPPAFGGEARGWFVARGPGAGPPLSGGEAHRGSEDDEALPKGDVPDLHHRVLPRRSMRWCEWQAQDTDAMV